MNEQKPVAKKYDLFLIAILLVSIVAFIVQAYFVSKINFIGTSDPAHYSEAAENFLKGEGFTLDYINQYFIFFDSITHPEEYGFPGVSLILIPSILLFGKTAFAVKLPSMIIGIILFPILTYFLGKEFFNNRIGFLAAVSMLVYPTIFNLSFGGERDTMFAFFVVASIYFFYKGLKEDNTKWFLIMGFFLGFSYLIRQATITVIPAIILAYYLMKKGFSRKFIYGMLVALAVISPWLVRNYLLFNDPFFTVNKYAGWLLGYGGYYESLFFSFFWLNTKPSLFTLLNLQGPFPFHVVYTNRLITSLGSQFSNFMLLNLLTFIGLSFKNIKEFTKRFSVWVAFLIIFGIGAFLLTNSGLLTLKYQLTISALLLSIPYIGILSTSLYLFRKDNKEDATFILLWVFFALFFSVIWPGGGRYWLVVVPVLLVYSWFALEKLVQKISGKIPKPQLSAGQIEKIIVSLLIIFVLSSLPQTFGKFLDKNAPFPFQDDTRSKDMMLLAGTVYNETESDAVIMGCDVAVFHFYNGRKYLEFPSASMENIVKVMKGYNVSYFTLLGCERRAIDIRFYESLFSNIVFEEKDYAQDSYDFVTGVYEPSIGFRRITIPKKYLLQIYKVEQNQLE